MKLKAVIYARYSSDKQSEQSIEGQLRECYSYAQRNNYIIVGEYVDRALTGTTDKRPEFLKMIEDSKKKGFNYVIVYQLDRFARNRYDSATYKAKLTKNDVRVISARENITDDASGILVEGMLESMAEYYSKELSQKTKRGMKETILKGKWTGGYVTYGYNIVNGCYVINEMESKNIRDIFNDIVKNVKLKDIVDNLNASGHKNKIGNPFSTNYICRVLRNRKYIGEVSQTYKSEVRIPQIVDIELFNRANEKLDENKGKNARAKANELYHLSGKTYCAYCNELITADSGTNHEGIVYKYYKCSARKKRKNNCKKTTIRKEYFENKIIDKTVQDILIPSVIDEIAKNVTESFNKSLKENFEIKSLEKQKKLIENKIDNILKAIEEGVLTRTTKDRLMKYESEKEDIESRLVIEQNKSTKPIEFSQVKAFLSAFANKDYSKQINRHRLLEIFVNRIYLYDEYAMVIYNGIDDAQTQLNLSNKKTEDETKFEFGSLGSGGRIRTYNPLLNRELRYHCATPE